MSGLRLDKQALRDEAEKILRKHFTGLMTERAILAFVGKFPSEFLNEDEKHSLAILSEKLHVDPRTN